MGPAGAAPAGANLSVDPPGAFRVAGDPTGSNEFSSGCPSGVVLGSNPRGVVSGTPPVGHPRGAARVVRLAGVGFKGFHTGHTLVMGLGYSHYVGVATTGVVRARTAGVVAPGGVAHRVVHLRRPDPYKGRGLYLDGQKPTTKAGKRR